ncbi:uncharacterized protein I303_105557 [Kwoniella dejecticola CBS 10117]|uniref:Pre-rRNA-processing protein TSR4 n=1 Tax=Kwoniella dejecticola CBS 10117 TaxID=1296121 RepID=A0A1A6A255_9TREE|nr:pre-rRNA-processing protein TSR4 [Kwoniella dejecticola CBS 10117]OBR84143.1 pre-rRNA-processing protein TSR4 [Kwoniella dejecticola CBS 10117]
MSPSSPAGSSSSSLSVDYTNVLLALPDGSIPSNHADAKSYTISSIGGYPTFPPLPNIPKEINCGICHQPIPLLTQVYCPLENGENDRVLYVFACARLKCQKRDGSVRAFRASKRNEEYVKDVEEKRKIAEAAAEAEREKARKNPFTLSSDAQPNGALFGSSQPLFGAATSSSPNPFASSAPVPAPQQSSSEAIPDVSKLSLSDAPSTSTTLGPPIPAYQPAQYLSTIEEYIPPAEDVDFESDSEIDGDEDMKATMLDDTWERMLPKHLDEVFQQFVRKLESSDGGQKQVLRYEFDGIPVPYSSASPITRKLFPGCEKPLKKDEELDLNELYRGKSSLNGIIPPCTLCGGERTFELQLVPYLISLLTPNTLSTTGEAADDKKKKQTEAERKKELEELAKKIKEGKRDDEVNEMEWGTIMVFACKRDCIGLTEEYVGVEWESSITI